MSERFLRQKFKPGWIEVIVGCMFSGKSEELIKQLRRSELAKLHCQTFKPKIDNRYHDTDVASHNNTTFPSTAVETSQEILNYVGRNIDVVGIDEGQFFDTDISEVVTKLADSGKRVIIAGLDTDWQGQPFGPIPHLMAIADTIQKQYAICMSCGEPATRTQRLVPASNSILVGSAEYYEARCRTCFDATLSLRLASLNPSDTLDQPQA